MRINLTSVLVDDQAKALAFYTDVLGFVPKHDIPLGEHRWLTVVSPDAARRHRAAARAVRPPGRRAVQGGARRRRHPVHVVRGRRRPGRARPARRPRRPLHPAADRDGPGHHGRLRRHLRQPHPDRHHPLTRRRDPGRWPDPPTLRACQRPPMSAPHRKFEERPGRVSRTGRRLRPRGMSTTRTPASSREPRPLFRAPVFVVCATGPPPDGCRSRSHVAFVVTAPDQCARARAARATSTSALGPEPPSDQPAPRRQRGAASCRRAARRRTSRRRAPTHIAARSRSRSSPVPTPPTPATASSTPACRARLPDHRRDHHEVPAHDLRQPGHVRPASRRRRSSA